MQSSPDTPHLALVDCGSPGARRLEAFASDLELGLSVVELQRANQFDFSGFSAIIISGGPQLFTDENSGARLIESFAFIDRLLQPTLGICLGHQALGIRSGSSCFRGVERRATERIRLSTGLENQKVHASAHCVLSAERAQQVLFAGLGSAFEMRTDHCEGISLPRSFVRLAESENYAVEAMAGCERPHFGVQFHPESAGEPGRVFLLNFLQLIGIAASEP